MIPLNRQSALKNYESTLLSPSSHPSSPIVLITGATGAVGPCVVEAIIQAGWRVRLLLRQPPAKMSRLWSENIEVVLGDITDAAALQRATQGCQAVVHMAALLHIVNPSTALHAQYEQVNVVGTRHIVQAACDQGVQRLIFFSTIAVYGPSHGALLNEASLARPDTVYGQTKLAAEQLVLQAQRADGQPLGVVLRLAAVYGARVKGNYQRLLVSLARGRFLAVGAGENRRTLVYDRDVAQATVLALHHPAAGGQVLNVTDGQLHTLQEILTTICMALGRTPPRFALPLGPVRWALGCWEKGMRLLGRQPIIGQASLEKYTEDIAVTSERIQQLLGFVPQFDLATGWQDVVATLRQQGKL